MSDPQTPQDQPDQDAGTHAWHVRGNIAAWVNPAVTEIAETTEFAALMHAVVARGAGGDIEGAIQQFAQRVANISAANCVDHKAGAVGNQIGQAVVPAAEGDEALMAAASRFIQRALVANLATIPAGMFVGGVTDGVIARISHDVREMLEPLKPILEQGRHDIAVRDSMFQDHLDRSLSDLWNRTFPDAPQSEQVWQGYMNFRQQEEKKARDGGYWTEELGRSLETGRSSYDQWMKDHADFVKHQLAITRDESLPWHQSNEYLVRFREAQQDGYATEGLLQAMEAGREQTRNFLSNPDNKKFIESKIKQHDWLNSNEVKEEWAKTSGRNYPKEYFDALRKGPEELQKYRQENKAKLDELDQAYDYRQQHPDLAHRSVNTGVAVAYAGIAASETVVHAGRDVGNHIGATIDEAAACAADVERRAVGGALGRTADSSPLINSPGPMGAPNPDASLASQYLDADLAVLNLAGNLAAPIANAAFTPPSGPTPCFSNAQQAQTQAEWLRSDQHQIEAFNALKNGYIDDPNFRKAIEAGPKELSAWKAEHPGQLQGRPAWETDSPQPRRGEEREQWMDNQKQRWAILGLNGIAQVDLMTSPDRDVVKHFYEQYATRLQGIIGEAPSPSTTHEERAAAISRAINGAAVQATREGPQPLAMPGAAPSHDQTVGAVSH